MFEYQKLKKSIISKSSTISLVIALTLGSTNAFGSDAANWSDKTICRLLVSSVSTEQQAMLMAEAGLRELACTSKIATTVNAKTRQVENSTKEKVIDKPQKPIATEVEKEESEAEIKKRAISKNFGFFNSPGQEIEKLVVKGKITEAYYIYQYNWGFFDEKPTFGGKRNGEKYKVVLDKLAESYFFSETAKLKRMTAKAKLFKANNDRPYRDWAEVKSIFDYRENLNKHRLIKRLDEYWFFNSAVDKLQLHYYEGYEKYQAVIESFIKNGLDTEGKFFDLYPASLSYYVKKKIIKSSLEKLMLQSTFNLKTLKKYQKYYDIDEDVVAKVVKKDKLENIVSNKSITIKEIFNQSSQEGSHELIDSVFASRGFSVEALGPKNNLGFILECGKNVCPQDDNAGVWIVVLPGLDKSFQEHDSYYETQVRIKSGFNTVANPRYNQLVRQLNELQRQIANKNRQDQINRQIYSQPSYQSNCTSSFGNQINCTTTQAPDYYGNAAASGKMIAESINSIFGLETPENKYQKLSNQLARTSPTIEKQKYESRLVRIPEIQIHRERDFKIHIFDTLNEQHLMLPVTLEHHESWLVPTDSAVSQLPAGHSAQSRIITNSLVQKKMKDPQRLDVSEAIYAGTDDLQELEYVSPQTFLTDVISRADILKSENNVEGKQVAKFEAEANLEVSYYELLGDDDFIKWAKSDPVRVALLKGFLEQNQTAVKILKNKWFAR